MSIDKIQFRELKPGKTLHIGGKKYKAPKIKVTKWKSDKEKKAYATKSTCMVPESLIKQLKLNDKHFVSVQKLDAAVQDKKQ